MTAARVLVFAIAILAVLDPSLTTSRSSRPLVSLIAADSIEDAPLVSRVERLLSRRFTVVRGPMPASSGTVLVGDRMPDDGAAGPLMVVAPKHESPFLRIVDLDAPSHPTLNASVPVAVTMVAHGARGSRLNVGVHVGDMLVDQQSTEPLERDTVEFSLTLPYIPTNARTTLLKVVASIEGTNVSDEATTAIDVTTDRFAVLFHDPRASWLSTFVRRAVERDPRFAVTHRVVTSRGLSNTSGSAPVSLRDAQQLSSYATIVVGSPEHLSDADVAGLEAFMRERGGRVVLLMDRRSAGPIDRLTAATGWRAVHLPAATDLKPPILDSRFALPAVKAQEIAWPATLPAGAFVHAASVARDSTRRPVAWSVPVGAGRLFVSGALDSWQHRDETSGFDAFWTSTIAQLAAGAPNAVEVSLTNRTIAPGEATTINARIRSAAITANRSATVSATLVGPNDTTTVRLWPGNSPGAFSGQLVGPREQGTYRIIVSAGVERAGAALVVDPTARAAARDERHLMSAYAASRQGRVIPEAELRDLPGALSSALQSVSRVETWHPMRSAGWIVPFALLLGCEWWWRRRRGLA